MCSETQKSIQQLRKQHSNLCGEQAAICKWILYPSLTATHQNKIRKALYSHVPPGMKMYSVFLFPLRLGWIQLYTKILPIHGRRWRWTGTEKILRYTWIRIGKGLDGTAWFTGDVTKNPQTARGLHRNNRNAVIWKSDSAGDRRANVMLATEYRKKDRKNQENFEVRL